MVCFAAAEQRQHNNYQNDRNTDIRILKNKHHQQEKPAAAVTAAAVTSSAKAAATAAAAESASAAGPCMNSFANKENQKEKDEKADFAMTFEEFIHGKLLF
jgi:hypothetical protein